ncbi:MAG: hypothetical protein ACD_63C00259G0001 [uncultured bacterium]|nr:MAG: hypothetical protein ACD_63C00259G0001 [uncultured bacterium]
MDSQEDINFFAETNFRNKKSRFGIKRDDRRRHMYVIGKTGMGKSHMLKYMAINDIMSGKGLAFIDPHGDAAEFLLDYIPSERVNDIVYINPTDIEYPVAFNVMEKVDRRYHNLVADGLIGIFKKIWADSWGPRLEYLLRNTILSLLDYQDSTLLGVTRMLVDKSFRKKVIKRIQDPIVKSFWVDEFSKYHDRFLVDAISPIQNKVGQFLANAVIRNMVGQPKSTINLRDIMDSGKILILNLSKGKIGEESSALLGAMIITKLQLAAMSRADVIEEKRPDFYLYVDEFQTFATDSFADILSEARKYRLNLVMAHQYITQMPETVRDAVFGNVGTLVTFRIGAMDAEELVKEFEPVFTENDLVNIPKFHIYIKLMIDGIASDAFSATTVRMDHEIAGNKEKVISVSRERYSNTRDVVEDKIARWSGVFGEKDEEEQPKSKRGYIKDGNVPRQRGKVQISARPRQSRPPVSRSVAGTHGNETTKSVPTPMIVKRKRSSVGYLKKAVKPNDEEKLSKKVRHKKEDKKEDGQSVVGISFDEAMSRSPQNFHNPKKKRSVSGAFKLKPEKKIRF